MADRDAPTNAPSSAGEVRPNLTSRETVREPKATPPEGLKKGCPTCLETPGEVWDESLGAFAICSCSPSEGSQARTSAGGAFPDDDDFTEAMRAMVIDLNGFVYAGERLDSYCATVRWLRTHPLEASLLLGDFPVEASSTPEKRGAA